MTIFILCAAVSILGIALYLLQVVAACSLVRKNRKPADAAPPLETSLPAVSILKPLRALTTTSLTPLKLLHPGLSRIRNPLLPPGPQ